MSFAGASVSIFVLSIALTWLVWFVAHRAPKPGIFLLPAGAALLGGTVSRLFTAFHSSGQFLIVIVLFAVLGAVGSLVCQAQIMLRASEARRQ